MSTAFAQILDDVFAGTAAAALSVEDERALILAAQLGDADAPLALIQAYAPAIRNAGSTYRNAGGAWATRGDDQTDDLRMSLIEGFLTAVRAFDLNGPHRRLAAIVSGYLRDEAASSLNSPIATAIPSRTLKRFFGILRTADGDVEEGARLAPAYEMKAETFRAIVDVMRRTGTLDAPEVEGSDGEGWENQEATPLYGATVDAIADAEDRILVAAAFRAVDPLEKEVVGRAYGFTDYEPVPDAEIADQLAMSRAAVQRKRAGALGKMRVALGVVA